jgi:hypothetical protein
MGSFKVLIAAAVLSSPWEVPAGDDAARVHAALAPSLRAVALGWEVLDRRETDDLLAHPENFAADLQELQKRFGELQNAPPVAEAGRFPARDLVNDLLAFNRAYMQDLNARLEVDTIHGDELRAAMLETEHLYKIWDCVRDVRTEYCFVNARRRALQQLRELVGDRAFYTGQLPPHVPMWRFPTGD